MRLTELEPEFVRYDTRRQLITVVVGDPLTWKDGDPTEEVERDVEWTLPVEAFGEAQAVQFLCPKCFAEKDGAVGCHLVRVTFADRGVTPTQGCHNSKGEPTRWQIVEGNSFDTLRLAPSILLEGGCNWHGHVGLTTAGDVTSC